MPATATPAIHFTPALAYHKNGRGFGFRDLDPANEDAVLARIAREGDGSAFEIAHAVRDWCLDIPHPTAADRRTAVTIWALLALRTDDDRYLYPSLECAQRGIAIDPPPDLDTVIATFRPETADLALVNQIVAWHEHGPRGNIDFLLANSLEDIYSQDIDTLLENGRETYRTLLRDRREEMKATLGDKTFYENKDGARLGLLREVRNLIANSGLCAAILAARPVPLHLCYGKSTGIMEPPPRGDWEGNLASYSHKQTYLSFPYPFTTERARAYYGHLLREEIFHSIDPRLTGYFDTNPAVLDDPSHPFSNFQLAGFLPGKQPQVFNFPSTGLLGRSFAHVKPFRYGPSPMQAEIEAAEAQLTDHDRQRLAKALVHTTYRPGVDKAASFVAQYLINRLQSQHDDAYVGNTHDAKISEMLMQSMVVMDELKEFPQLLSLVAPELQQFYHEQFVPFATQKRAATRPSPAPKHTGTDFSAIHAGLSQIDRLLSQAGDIGNANAQQTHHVFHSYLHRVREYMPDVQHVARLAQKHPEFYMEQLWKNIALLSMRSRRLLQYHSLSWASPDVKTQLTDVLEQIQQTIGADPAKETDSLAVHMQREMRKHASHTRASAIV